MALTPDSAGWTGRENLHTLACYGFPLGVTCGCGHRSLVELATLGAHSGNMKPVTALRLRCTACGSQDWAPTIFNRAEEVAAFLQRPASAPTF